MIPPFCAPRSVARLAVLTLGLWAPAAQGQDATSCVDPDAGVIEGRTYADVVAGLHGEALPGRRFRVYIRVGVEEFRPEAIDDANRARRRIMIAMLQGVAGASTPLHPRLRDLIARTDANHREHFAYIINDGTLGPITVGEPGSVDIGDPPPHAVGMVHTHPTPCAILAPPSGGDYGGHLSFERFPVQMVVECNRIWGVLEPHHATLLGTLTADGGFQPVPDSDPTSARAYSIIDGDTLRLARVYYDECRARERREARERVMRELSERRRAEADERRRQLHDAAPDGGTPGPDPTPR